MADQVTIHAAKTHLSELLRRVEAGEEIIIARGDKPVAKLTPIPAERPKRVAGAMKHLIGDIPDSFFEPLSDEEAGYADSPTDPLFQASPAK